MKRDMIAAMNRARERRPGSGGKSPGLFKRRRELVDGAPGSWARLVQEGRARWDCDKAQALSDYRWDCAHPAGDDSLEGFV
jgi:hypothetical protein